MPVLRILAKALLHGPDADLIRHDLDELYARERADGVSGWRASARYGRRLAASALSIWREGRHAQHVQGARAPAWSADSTLQDLRFALRLFRKHPGPVAIVVSGLALAIGAVTAVFSLVNASMLRPYAMDDPASVVRVMGPGHGSNGWSYRRFLAMRDGVSQDIVRLEASRDVRVRVGGQPVDPGDAERTLLFVSGGYLQMLGGRPAMGRVLGPADDEPGSAAVVVVSYHFWQTVLAADPAVVGRRLHVNGALVAIAGVLRSGFTGPVRMPPAIWATFAAYDDLNMGPAFRPDAAAPVDVIGRLGPGVAMALARERLSGVTGAAGEDIAPRSNGTVSPTVRVASAASPIDVAGDVEAYTVIACVLALAALILMLACVNAGNLLMAAAVTRRTEIGTRLALGATRSRLWRQLISESLLLGGLAGVLGILFTLWIVPIAAAQIQLPPEVDLAPDSSVFVFVAGVALMCGLGAGLSPARHGARGHLLASLQGGGPHLAGMPSRFRTSFVGVQAAASMLLLVLAALLTRSAVVTTRVDVGFEADRLLAVSLTPVQAGLDQAVYLRAALAAVEQVPGVEQASATWSAPFSSFGDRQRVERNGRRYVLEVNSSDEAFLRTAGVVLLRGRTFTQEEVGREAPVAMLSAQAAETLFHGADPIGQSLTVQPAGDRRRQESATVIGVVADAVLSRPDDENLGIIYRPLKREGRVVTDRGLSYPPDLLVRAASPAVAAGIEDALRRVDARVRPDVRFVRHTIDSWLAGTRMLAWTMAPPALLALVLAALGVFGVTAFVATQRLREVSVRMALGASAGDIRRLLIADGLRPVVIGLATGLGAALLVGRTLGSHFLWISPYDPLSVLLATVALLTCALVAVALPVRRVSKADPAGLLRV